MNYRLYIETFRNLVRVGFSFNEAHKIIEAVINE